MRKAIFVALLCTAFVLEAHAARRVVRTRTVRGTRTRVVVHTGFPVRRTLPNVVVRPHRIVVAPRVYLGTAAFVTTVVTVPANATRVWSGSDKIERGDGWTDFALDIDRRGTRLLLDVNHGDAQISFAEVVFENGEAQVIDFNDATVRHGVYSLLDFKDGRKVDHVRLVAQSLTPESSIHVILLS